MSEAPLATESPVPETWPVLSLKERRVRGVLVEKAKTTPDAYPLTINALTTGCNQKSNREPVMNLTDLDVEDALSSVQKRGLVMRITGSRVERWRHVLYDAWSVNKHELAILAELLLRGPQTEGELRARASRMEQFEDLETLRTCLGPMSKRGLVLYLTPPGQRGTTLTHGFHDPQEIQALQQHSAEGTSVDAKPAVAPVADWQRELEEAWEEIRRLKEQVETLTKQMEEV